MTELMHIHIKDQNVLAQIHPSYKLTKINTEPEHKQKTRAIIKYNVKKF